MTEEKLVVDLTFRLCLDQTMMQQMPAVLAKLCLGIIDRFSSEDLQAFDMERFAAIVESIILGFSREVNKVHDYSMMPDIREAYDILSKNKLLSHVFDFTKIFVYNYEVHSFELQSKFLQQLQTAKIQFN